MRALQRKPKGIWLLELHQLATFYPLGIFCFLAFRCSCCPIGRVSGNKSILCSLSVLVPRDRSHMVVNSLSIWQTFYWLYASTCSKFNLFNAFHWSVSVLPCDAGRRFRLLLATKSKLFRSISTETDKTSSLSFRFWNPKSSKIGTFVVRFTLKCEKAVPRTKF